MILGRCWEITTTSVCCGRMWQENPGQLQALHCSSRAFPSGNRNSASKRRGSHSRCSQSSRANSSNSLQNGGGIGGDEFSLASGTMHFQIQRFMTFDKLRALYDRPFFDLI